jgi:hypothetical protein
LDRLLDDVSDMREDFVTVGGSLVTRENCDIGICDIWKEESKEATQKGHGLKIKIVLKTNGRSATKIMLACLSVRDITLAVLFFFSAGRRY